ncbi:MAG TPA: alpha-hydroxy acid oxidase [Vicinamibacterales bacterium]|nr:alpha-hydroxy acid oxidase [Vicinamibacterales bacterium]
MFISIEDLRSAARRRLPRAVFDYVEGGAGDELTVCRNVDGFARYALRPRVFTDVGTRDISATVLGTRVPLPVIVAPTGLLGMIRPRGEIAIARAAAAHGIPVAVSSMATCALEEVAREAKSPLWFQMYIWRDRGLTRAFADRARDAGCQAICLTLDVQVLATRDRDRRHGLFTVPSRVRPRAALGVLARPAWLARMARGPLPTFGNFVGVSGAGTTPKSLGAFATSQLDPTVTWRDLDWFRSVWHGPLVLKGILAAEDARIAVAHGADAVVVSNHGGRQLDGATGAIEALPEIVEAVGGRADVILDGGVRRGRDIVTAIALGATACMAGRPVVYGLAAAGQRGAERAIEILREEVDRTLALLGARTLARLDRSALFDTAAERLSSGTCTPN